MTQIATLVFIAGICGLFWLDHDSKVKTSPALWLPVLWLMIAGSRPLTLWLNTGSTVSADQYLEGSPIDRAIYTTMLVLGLAVLFGRSAVVGKFLRANWPLLILVLYCAASIAWSDYPDVAFKRWIKSLNDYVMILIILTDAEPLAALKRVFARVGFVLLPASILFIKYYPEIGRVYASHWDSTVFFVGVTTDKNMLGMTCLVFGLASMWRFLTELRGSEAGRKAGSLIAHGAMVLMTIYLFSIVNSMTSLSCFVLGSVLMAVTTSPKLGRKRMLVHAMLFASVAFCFCVLFLNLGDSLLATIGRNSTLTGRTDLWDTLLKMDTSPVAGSGFESFWLGSRLEKLWSIYWWHPNESHNGYLEMYLNLGWIGIGLLAGLAVAGYRNITKLLLRDPEAGRLRLAFFLVGIAYNFTEAAIRTMGLVWVAFLLCVMAVPEVPVPLPAFVSKVTTRIGTTRKRVTPKNNAEEILA